ELCSSTAPSLVATTPILEVPGYQRRGRSPLSCAAGGCGSCAGTAGSLSVTVAPSLGVAESAIASATAVPSAAPAAGPAFTLFFSFIERLSCSAHNVFRLHGNFPRVYDLSCIVR